jgi:A/G-specific adenine glycosylase
LASGEPERFPEARKRTTRPHKFGLAYWIERQGRVWLVRRPTKGMLGGMAALPGGEWTAEPPSAPGTLGTVSHIFTHFSLDLTVVARSATDGEGWWHPIDALDDAGLPTLYRRAAETVLKGRGLLAA